MRTIPLAIGFVFSDFAPGGTERQMSELVRRLNPARWRVHVACLRADGSWLARVKEVAPITAFDVRSLKSVATLRQMRALAGWCADRDISVLHSVDLPSNIFAQPAAALARVPARIANRREVNPGRSAHEIVAQRFSYACAHRVVANCGAAAERLRDELVPARKISVVANGLDLAGYPPRGPIARVRRVAMVANLRPEKGQDVLLDAAATVVRHFPDARFTLVGGGPEREALRARAESLGLTTAVTFVGHCEDVPGQLADADMFVLPSRSEAFPNAVLEAMAVGLPAIASRVGGLLEVIEDGRTGLLVPPGDSSALATAICRLMANAAEAAQLGAAARARAATYSFTRMVGKFEEIYLTELTRHGIVCAPHPDAVAS